MESLVLNRRNLSSLNNSLSQERGRSTYQVVTECIDIASRLIMKKWIGLFLFAPMMSQAMGLIELPGQEKVKLESKINQGLGLPQSQLIVKRLGIERQRTYNFQFGKLTKEKFERIRSFFAHPLNNKLPELKYDSTHSYDLEDFLLPKMQAPLGKTFESVETVDWLYPVSGIAQIELPVQSNCWSTAYDILRSDVDPENLRLYAHLNERDVLEVFRDNRHFVEVAFENLKAFDVLLFLTRDRSGVESIDHAAVYLGLGLIYEKTGLAGGLDFYQIRPLEDVISQRQAINAGTEFRMEYRRLISSLPSQEALFGASAKGVMTEIQLQKIPLEFRNQIVLHGDVHIADAYARIRPLKILKNQFGRYELDPQDSLTADFRSPKIVGTVSSGGQGFSDSALISPSCRIVGNPQVEVLESVKRSFLVRLLKMQVDESASCVDSFSNPITEFWIPVSALNSST